MKTWLCMLSARSCQSSLPPARYLITSTIIYRSMCWDSLEIRVVYLGTETFRYISKAASFIYQTSRCLLKKRRHVFSKRYLYCWIYKRNFHKINFYKKVRSFRILLVTLKGHELRERLKKDSLQSLKKNKEIIFGRAQKRTFSWRSTALQSRLIGLALN
jgi:hypothetical protein